MRIEWAGEEGALACCAGAHRCNLGPACGELCPCPGRDLLCLLRFLARRCCGLLLVLRRGERRRVELEGFLVPVLSGRAVLRDQGH